jgi:hypothetical protein
MAETDIYNAVSIARGILDGSIPLFLGCKQLCGPLHRLEVSAQEPFVTIIGVESETDAFPILPQDRKMWNQQRLAEKDAKLAAYLPKIREPVLVACREIIDRFEKSAYAPGNWSVYRIDDNGNEFVVRAHIDEKDATRIVSEFEAHGHKQTYWAQQDPVE